MLLILNIISKFKHVFQHIRNALNVIFFQLA